MKESEELRSFLGASKGVSASESMRYGVRPRTQSPAVFQYDFL